MFLADVSSADIPARARRRRRSESAADYCAHRRRWPCLQLPLDDRIALFKARASVMPCRGAMILRPVEARRPLTVTPRAFHFLAFQPSAFSSGVERTGMVFSAPRFERRRARSKAGRAKATRKFSEAFVEHA